MENKRKLKTGEKISYGLGAIGKDMVYMLSASYVLYYFQDILGVNAAAMGVILLAARIFDAFNDPIMGVIVAKTKTGLGKFRPWLLIGTLTNAVILFMMFAAPPSLNAGGLIAYAAIAYILWGITYTMMDIPYWSMIPAFTEGGTERENLTTLARSCAGIGSALITVITMLSVQKLGVIFGNSGASAREIERIGFKWFTLGVAIIFIVFETVCVICIKEKSTVDMKSPTVKDMFRALVQNDQAMTVVVTIVLINCSIYLTSNLVIYFFKYDFGGTNWYNSYTLFNTFGGASQILAMMILYPLLRNGFKLNSIKIFYITVLMAVAGYITLLLLSFTKMHNVFILFIPGFFIFAATGLFAILTTVFLANTVDYGEMKNISSNKGEKCDNRNESVIFSMQTFVVKLASGVAIFIASMSLQIFKLSDAATTAAEQGMDLSVLVSTGSKIGLRLTMSLLPVIGLFFGFMIFKMHYILNDETLEDISRQLKDAHANEKNALN